MGSKKHQTTEPEDRNTTKNGDTELQKKHKRKLEEAEAEIFTESKKDLKKKKKKKKEKREEEAEILNGSDEISVKRKKKGEEEGEKEIFSDGSVEKSKKKKETDNDRGEKTIQEVRESSGVLVSGNNVNDSKYRALNSFAESGLPSEVLECCKNFDKPSPIQSQSWPFLLEGRDFIGIAKTGSGKTLAFGIPAIVHVLSKRKSKISKKVNPLCLILSPTRELAQQVCISVVYKYVICCLYNIALHVYGFEALNFTLFVRFQYAVVVVVVTDCKSNLPLTLSQDIVIGTPGRLKDLIEMGVCHLKEVSFVVLDEADRMLDMGFEPEVRSILSQTNTARQMVMFSATWPPAVHQLAQEFMDPCPVKVVVGSEDLTANHDVMQIVEVLDDRARDERLQCLLEKYHKSRRNRVLVFVLYKKEASRVESMLQRRGWKVASISGDKAQYERTKALSLFKEGTCPLMIATDVAARGLDIPDVEVVINYSFPLTTEDYVHRIGRTGRAGKKGVAHTFFTKENKGLAGELINVLKEAQQVVPEALLKFGTHVKKKESKLYGAHFREIDSNAPKATKIKFDCSDDED
ncbi:DEAD-box ATP-dependent RNA helicase 5 [Olea europaea var. sylvestris]|uniref:DEAD-box ATP-dependent RNA helicase 5 n=1 Tax=Olea europaea var. sylvestris TaxID=158386 RepID=UPI000C1D3DD4|nr:DEAD-box ATP-dependent RNA helicase 5 [Olea europaea var. sylvestris]